MYAYFCIEFGGLVGQMKMVKRANKHLTGVGLLVVVNVFYQTTSTNYPMFVSSLICAAHCACLLLSPVLLLCWVVVYSLQHTFGTSFIDKLFPSPCVRTVGDA